MVDETNPPDSGNRRPQADAAAAGSEFPTDPFACPSCGQMLGATVRVCASCKQPIDPAQIHMPRPAAPPAVYIRSKSVTLPSVRFPWPVLFLVFGVWFVVAVTAQRVLGPVKSQLVLAGVVVLSSAWVFYDAQERRVPKPLRWSLGSLLLWIVVFPWYLARRRAPEAPCPFVEAEASLLTRVLLVILITFFLFGAVWAILQGPLR